MKARYKKLGIAALLGCAAFGAARADVTQSGAVTAYVPPAQASASGIDFAHAKALPLPSARGNGVSPTTALLNARTPMATFGLPGGSAGGLGDGKAASLALAPPQDPPKSPGVSPQEFGTSAQPFTTSEVNSLSNNTASTYPFRAAGKLFFKINGSSYVCSASLIKPGILVTAAHCVANYGARQFYSNWVYVPAYRNGVAPYGTWSGASARVLTSYYAGTDGCAVYGVVCPNDVAIIRLAPQSGRYAGNSTGWFGYGWNGYGFNSSSQALINQLGYPVDLDGGLYMQRNDSQGFVQGSFSSNTIIGSLMTGGSSGGPWLVNLGMPPSLSGGDTFGTYASHNIVVGVTSWGYNNLAVKQQGAAPFTSGNITVLVNAECAAVPGAC